MFVDMEQSALGTTSPNKVKLFRISAASECYSCSTLSFLHVIEISQTWGECITVVSYRVKCVLQNLSRFQLVPPS